jgi:hypothetical protein
MKMHFPSLLVGLAVALGLAGCGGGDDGAGPDAYVASDGGPEPDGRTVACDYTEAADADNDTTAEATGLTTDARGLRICGQLDARAPVDNVVDVDTYTFEVGRAGSFLIRVDGNVGTELAVVVSDTILATGGDGSFRGDGVYIGDHLVYVALLEADVFQVSVRGLAESEPAGAVAYTISILEDAPDARCATVTGNAAYVEAADGVGNLDNDVATVHWSPAFATAQTAALTDAPEPSGAALAITAGMSYKATGTAATPNGGAVDDYLDRDTYVIATGGDTNELAIRLTWTGDTADLDFLLFVVPSGTSAPVPIAFGTFVGNTAPELATTATLRSTQYWLWVGNYDGSDEPQPYELTLCGYDYDP